MGFKMLKAPRDPAELEKEGLRIVKAMTDFGAMIDAKGFLTSWLGGSKILVEEDDTGKITTLAIMVSGQRWYDSYATATILDFFGENIEGIIGYAKDIASASGAYSMFYDEKRNVELDNGDIRHFMMEVKL